MARFGGRRLIMKPINLFCPICKWHFGYKNYWHWVWKAPFHWFGKRLTKCPFCGYKSWMKREK